MAGIRLLIDTEDTLALAELVQYLPEHKSASSWLTEMIENPETAFNHWQQNPKIIRLLALKERAVESGPLELMHLVTDALGVTNDLYSSENPKQALANIEALEQLVSDYQNICSSRRQGASLPGLMYWLSTKEDPGLPEGKGDNTVQVCSYHKSKGLEWPFVILFDLDTKPKFSPFGIHVESLQQFDPEKPLANRSIRYWPEPVSGKELLFTSTVEASKAFQDAEADERAERKRLMYVGITRARDYLILTQPRGKRAGKTVWLNELMNESKYRFELPEGTNDSINVDGILFECFTRQFQAFDKVTSIANIPQQWYLPQYDGTSAEYLPYAISPSSYKPHVDVDVSVEIFAKLGERTKLNKKADIISVGETVHGFIAADQPGLNDQQRIELAAGLLSGWNISEVLTPEQLLEFSVRLHKWIALQWPEAKIFKEWPMNMRLANQVVHGWIDMLLELPDGYVVIDHKSYPGDDPEKKAMEFAAQLDLYCQAIEKATNKKVIKSLIHMPLQGCVLSIIKET